MKKEVVIILLLGMCLTAFSFEQGDVNHDGEINITDYTLLNHFALGNQFKRFYNSEADVNCDSKIDLVDAFYLYQFINDNKRTLGCGIDGPKRQVFMNSELILQSYPKKKKVNAGDKFETYVILNIGNYYIEDYNFVINFDDTMVSLNENMLDYSEEDRESGKSKNGVVCQFNLSDSPDSDQHSYFYVDKYAGRVVVSGNSRIGITTGLFFTIYWTAKADAVGSPEFKLSLGNMAGNGSGHIEMKTNESCDILIEKFGLTYPD